MSASLIPISNEKLLAQIGLRHVKVNLDFEHIQNLSASALGDADEYKAFFERINWNSISFEKDNRGQIPEEPGVYMFTFCPYSYSLAKHEAQVVLYIGQAKDLRNRFNGYLSYPNSKKPTDQLRRTMIVLWGNRLNFYFYPNSMLNKKDLDTIEFGLIDAILPPFNKEIKSSFSQAYKKLLT
jgi:hypothetical protein